MKPADRLGRLEFVLSAPQRLRVQGFSRLISSIHTTIQNSGRWEREGVFSSVERLRIRWLLPSS
jgi:hypothetical protein